MTKTPNTIQADGPAPALDLAGVAAALIGLAQAVAAVARFPNSPVPPSLVDRIGAAEDELRAAVEDLPGALAVTATAEAYDDSWIKERFESLDQALADKFKTFAVAQTVTEAFVDRDKAIEQLVKQVSAVEDLGKDLAKRFDSLKPAAPAAKPQD